MSEPRDAERFDVGRSVRVREAGPDFGCEGTVLYWSEPWNLDTGAPSRTQRKCCVRIYGKHDARYVWVHADYLEVVE